MLRWNIHAAHTALQASTHLSEVCPSTHQKKPAKYMGVFFKKCMICIEIIEIIATSSTDFDWLKDIPGMDVGWCGILCSLMGVVLTYDDDLGYCRFAHLCNQRPCFPKTSGHEKLKGPPERR